MQYTLTIIALSLVSNHINNKTLYQFIVRFIRRSQVEEILFGHIGLPSLSADRSNEY